MVSLEIERRDLALQQEAKIKLARFVEDVKDFPVAGVNFKDITPLLRNPEALQTAIDLLLARYYNYNQKADYVAIVEARGFIFGAAMAYEMGAGLLLVRKPGKLPAATNRVESPLKYGTNVWEMHKDPIKPRAKVLVVDDLLATGKTASATVELVEQLDGEIVSLAFLLEDTNLCGREKIKNYDIFSLIQY